MRREADRLAWEVLVPPEVVWARERERELRRVAMREAAIAGDLAPGLR